MYFSSLHGHGTSFWPASSGAPTECRQGTYFASVPIFASTSAPVRAMIRIERDDVRRVGDLDAEHRLLGGQRAHAERHDVHACGRFIEPRYSSVIRAFISAGSIQLLVGPASASSTEQMKVRCSTRATSDGSVRAQNEFGFFSSLSRTSVPAGDQLVGQRLVLRVGAVDPVDPVRLGEFGDLGNPGQQARVLSRGAAQVVGRRGAGSGRGLGTESISVWAGLAVVVIGGSFPLAIVPAPVPSLDAEGVRRRPPGSPAVRFSWLAV